MARRTIRIGSAVDIFAYDDAGISSSIETDQPVKAGAPVDSNDVLRKGDVPGSPLSGLTANRLVDTDGSGDVESVSDLTDYIAGTANEITVIDDTDGSVTIEGAGSDTNFTVVSSIQVGGAGAIGFQYRTRTLTLNGGIITTVGAESGWNDI